MKEGGLDRTNRNHEIFGDLNGGIGKQSFSHFYDQTIDVLGLCIRKFKTSSHIIYIRITTIKHPHPA